MLSIRLKPALERRLSRLARQTGRTKTFYATKLIEENIEDLEDRYLAEARLEKRREAFTNAGVKKELGLKNPSRRKISKCIKLLPESSKAVVDSGFASDVDTAVEAHRDPLHPPAWD